MRAARWSETEVQQLRKFATKVTVAELTQKIGRSRGAVTAKAFELRLSLKSDASAAQRRLQPRSLSAERASRDQ
jgi:hypothetical protein